MTGPRNGSSRPEDSRTATRNHAYSTQQEHDQHTAPGLRVSSSIAIDVRREHDADRLTRCIQAAAEAPAGAIVTLKVERGQYPPQQAVDYLHQFGQHLGRLHVESSDLYTGEVWTAAIRGYTAGSDA